MINPYKGVGRRTLFSNLNPIAKQNNDSVAYQNQSDHAHVPTEDRCCTWLYSLLLFMISVSLPHNSWTFISSYLILAVTISYHRSTVAAIHPDAQLCRVYALRLTDLGVGTTWSSDRALPTGIYHLWRDTSPGVAPTLPDEDDESHEPNCMGRLVDLMINGWMIN